MGIHLLIFGRCTKQLKQCLQLSVLVVGSFVPYGGQVPSTHQLDSHQSAIVILLLDRGDGWLPRRCHKVHQSIVMGLVWAFIPRAHSCLSAVPLNSQTLLSHPLARQMLKVWPNGSRAERMVAGYGRSVRAENAAIRTQPNAM